MPSLDSNIALSSKIGENDSPMQALGQALNITNALAEQRLRADDLRKRKLAADKLAQDAHEDSIFRGLVAEHTDPATGRTNTDLVSAGLAARGAGDMKLKFDTDVEEWRKKSYDADTAGIDKELKLMSQAKNVVGSISNDATLAVAKKWLVQNYGSERGQAYADSLGQTYDSETVSKAGTLADEFVGHLTKQQQYVKEAWDARKAATADGTDAAAVLDKQEATARNLASLARTPQEYAGVIAKLRDVYHYSDAVLDRLPAPKAWTKDTPKLLTRSGMTAQQRESDDIQRGRNAQIQAHETEMERIARERLSGATFTPDVDDAILAIKNKYQTFAEADVELGKSFKGWSDAHPELDYLAVRKALQQAYVKPAGTAREPAAGNVDVAALRAAITGDTPKPAPTTTPKAPSTDAFAQTVANHPDVKKLAAGDEFEVTLKDGSKQIWVKGKDGTVAPKK